MSRFGIAALIFACLAALGPATTNAALDLTDPADQPSDLEIVVIEAPGCIYCHLFRRDVWPTYENSQLAKQVPMRFVDLNSKAADEISLQSPIDSLPTALVIRQKAEIGRIPGYVGPESFFHSIDRLLASAP